MLGEACPVVALPAEPASMGIASCPDHDYGDFSLGAEATEIGAEKGPKKSVLRPSRFPARPLLQRRRGKHLLGELAKAQRQLGSSPPTAQRQICQQISQIDVIRR